MECLKGGASPKHSSTATKGISSVLFVKKVLHMTFEHSCSRSSIGKHSHISESYLETIFAHVFFYHFKLLYDLCSCMDWTSVVCLQVGMFKIHPEIPDSMSLEAKAFILRCFEPDPDRRATALDLLTDEFLTVTSRKKKSKSGFTGGFNSV